MAVQDFFERDIMLATADFQPEAVNKALATFAKEQLREVIAKGQAPNRYDRYVNGVHGAPEEAVKAPGPIIYDFVNWGVVINETLIELKKKVPVKSGRYQRSFVVLVNGAIVEDYRTIPAGVEVIIFNTQPYTRKMESGHIKSGAGKIERVKPVMTSRYRDVFDFTFKYMDRSDGLAAGVPYILKRNGKRKDRQAGMPITYPSIIIKAI